MLAYSAKDISLTVKVLWDKTKGRKIRKLFLPILRPLSVVGLAVFRLPGDGIQFALGLPLGLVKFALFLLGKLLIRDEFLHKRSSLRFLESV